MSTSDISPRWRGAPEVHQAPGSIVVCFSPTPSSANWSLYNIRDAAFTHRADIALFYDSHSIDAEDVQSRGILKQVEVGVADFSATVGLTFSIDNPLASPNAPSPADAYVTGTATSPLPAIKLPALAYIHQFWLKLLGGPSAPVRVVLHIDCPARKPQ